MKFSIFNGLCFSEFMSNAARHRTKSQRSGSSLWGGELAYPPIETKQAPPTREAYIARVENERLMLIKARELKKITIFDVLAEAGVTNVTIEFDGEGDSGQISGIDFTPSKDSTALLATSVTISHLQWDQQDLSLLSTTLADALERLCYGFLEQECEGWEINDGSYGAFEFDVAARAINLDFNERIIDSNQYKHIV